MNTQLFHKLAEFFDAMRITPKSWDPAPLIDWIVIGIVVAILYASFLALAWTAEYLWNKMQG